MSDTIYRIQDSTGRGPYRPGWSHQWQEISSLIDGSSHPTFMEEFPCVIDKINARFELAKGHFGCGFRSLQQLNKWFTNPEQDKLKRLGYSIVKIVPDQIMAESDKQLVFWCMQPLNEVSEVVLSHHLCKF